MKWVLESWSSGVLELQRRRTPPLQYSNSSSLRINQGLVLCGAHGLEFPQAGPDFPWLAAMANYRVESLQAVAGDAKNGGILGGNPAAGNEFLGHGCGHAPGRLGENPFALGEHLDALADLV